MVSAIRTAPIERATNRGWEWWLEFLESIGADQRDHLGIALLVEVELTGQIENPAWWAQSITIAYEQHIGRRVPGQREDGRFQASASKATAIDMYKLALAWRDFAAVDPAVVAQVAEEPRINGSAKRIIWRAKGHDGIEITVRCEPKNVGRASVVAQVVGSRTAESNEAVKAEWKEILNRFASGL